MPRCTPTQLLDDGYLAQRARLIDPRRAQRLRRRHAAAGGTIYLTAADERGMMVCFIQCNYMGFGSRRRGAGLRACQPAEPRPRLQRSTRRSPNVRRARQAAVPHHHPGLPDARTAGRVMSFGVMGGNMQPQGHLQTLVRMLDHRQQPQAACDAPRWRFNDGLAINVEATMDAATVAGLREPRPRGRGRSTTATGLRRRPVHLAPRRSGRRGLRRRQRSASRRPGRRLLRRRATPSPTAPAAATPQPRAPLGPGSRCAHGRLDRVLGQGDHRQARLPLRRRCGDADHVPHAVRAAAVRACSPGGPGAAGRR